MTGLVVLESRMVPPLRPTKPPAMLFGPVLATGPDEVDRMIRPGLSLLSTPMNPPRMLLPPPVTAPLAELSAMRPSLPPASPPARLPAPTLTLPLACPSMMSAVLKYGDPSPSVQLMQLKFLFVELDPTSPPATLPLPVRTLPVAIDERIVPELSPTNPPACRLATLPVPTLPLAVESEISP